jgi:hypothetical protein
MRYHLLEDVVNVTNTNGLSDFGGAGDVFRIIHDKLCEFYKRTGISQVEATLAEVGNGVYTLPADFLDIHRVEVGGVRIFPTGQFEADRENSAWESDTGDIYGYYVELSTALTLTLVPKRTAQTVKVIHTLAPTNYSGDVATGLAATFPLPYGLRWIIKWGVLADLLSQEGELHDPVRAASAQALWENGIIMTRLFRGLSANG